MIKALSHITLIVRDVEKTGCLLSIIFDAKEIYDSSAKNWSLSNEKFFIIGWVWIAVMEGEPAKDRSYDHIAFKISDADFDEYISRIKKLGLDIRPGRPRVKGEARSVYFYDYDNHLFELHTGTLEDRLKRYSGMRQEDQ
jgi:catechol 2,3-dioxygenase-like lactoylglutathione lyase family enzyme